MKFLALLFALVLPFAGCAADDLTQVHSSNLASLIAPDKLATLGKRGANQRIQKAVAILETARLTGCQVVTVASNAVVIAGYTNALLAQLTRDSLTTNHSIAGNFGVLTESGLNDMRRGQSPTIKRDPYQGQELSVDHIVPFAVAPELDNVIANLELMPLKLNLEKSDAIGQRERTLAQKFYAVGLLTTARLKEILKR